MTDESTLSLTQKTSPEAIDALLARVQGLPGRRSLRTWVIPGTMLVGFVAAMVGLGTAAYLDSAWPVIIVIALICGSGIGVWTLAERREMRTITALAACKDLRVVGGLLDSVNYSNPRVRKLVQATLLDLLPRLTEEHSTLLGTGQREVLNALLYGKSGELALAALSAIERVGDGTALPYLTSIAAGKGVPVALRQRREEVQERARQTVATIRERIENQNRANVLLRASQASDAPSHQLVRPAYNQSHVNAHELLRAETNVEDDTRDPRDSHGLVE